MPSVSACVTTSSPPQPDATSAATDSRASRRMRTGPEPIMGPWSLQPADGRALSAPATLLEDPAQPLERLRRAALEPAAAARERLHRLVRGQRRLRLVGELPPCAPARGGLQHPLRVGLDAVELAPPPDADDAPRRLHGGDAQVAPAEAIQPGVGAE